MGNNLYLSYFDLFVYVSIQKKYLYLLYYHSHISFSFLALVCGNFLVWANASNGLGQTKQGTQPEEKRENNNRFIEIVF